MIIETSEEQELIAQCIAQNKQAEYALYQAYVNTIYHTIIRLCGDRHEAEELVQQTFIKVFKSLKTFRQEGSLEGWIKRIAVNTSLNHLRKRKNKRMHFLEVDSEQDVAVRAEGDFLMVNEIHKAIKLLPLGSRLVFSLFALEGYSHKEIAEELSVTESTSKTQYHRAKQLLRQQLNPIIENGY